MIPRRRTAVITSTTLAALAAAAPSAAQPAPLAVGAHAVLGWSTLDPAPGGARASAVAAEQVFAMAMLRAAGGRFRVVGMVNLEGATMPGGVLAPGAFGEGFMDRRHPHTYLHELVATGVWPGRPMGMSLTVGKGFAAFGSDDPTNRPALRFPVNHHWAQILERLTAVLGVRAGPLVVEGSLFNGDEPDAPDAWPNATRFGDSWALRMTLQPARGLEMQGSRARVASPEHREGSGPTSWKWSASARYLHRWSGGPELYGLAEWARTTEAEGFFVFPSALIEAQLRAGPHRPYVRLEWTDRPEEERTLDPYRSVRPHLDDALLGITRWRIQTVGYGFSVRVAGTTLEPILEVARAAVGIVGGGVFTPADFYGGATLWSATAALRVRVGTPHRMGRYGVLDESGDATAHSGH
ncbi:MAG: hypothetical protein OER21_03910 [Gemmatimonadota bacterium]|nr:hypothetical protein [Gemmatimonadota bacterium]